MPLPDCINGFIGNVEIFYVHSSLMMVFQDQNKLLFIT
jgi:hypothetical protein